MNDPEVKVIILRAAGTNCDEETAFAFQSTGAHVDLVHINKLLKGEATLRDYHILVFPGGFTYGDDIAAGKILANELKLRLGGALRQFINDGKLILGICNGFQIMTKAGILPGSISPSSDFKDEFIQKTTLTFNDSGKFEDRWIYLKSSGRCVWTEELSEMIYLPIAHGEGKFVTDNEETLNQLKANHQIVFRYCDPKGNSAGYPFNPNGSMDDIAGITDATGRILGLMPHPERHFLFIQHPYWTRLAQKGKFGDGAKIFENGVNFIRKKFSTQKNTESYVKIN